MFCLMLCLLLLACLSLFKAFAGMVGFGWWVGCCDWSGLVFCVVLNLLVLVGYTCFIIWVSCRLGLHFGGVCCILLRFVGLL